MWTLFAEVLLVTAAIQSSVAIVPLPKELEKTLADSGSANILVAIGESPLGICQKARSERDPTKTSSESTVELIQKLKNHATTTQKPILDLLQHHGVRHFKSYWISNLVYVKQCSAAIISVLQNHEAVTQITEEQIYSWGPIMPSKTTRAASWGIDSINAPAVWAKNITGQGVRVATIDTGVRWTHTKLRPNYLGLWFDPGKNTSEPNDQVGHGTHTMGTIVGLDGFGVAYDAKWLTCKGCQTNGCTQSDLLSCGQWIPCPDTEANGCQMKPHLCSNSWGGPGVDLFYQSTVACWQAMDIIPIFANGNSGPNCGSSGSPGRYNSVISVGAFDSSNNLASFSSRGLSIAPDLTFPPANYKPDISAPGVAITSTWHTSDVATSAISGTSMATPHVAGVIALIFSACPRIQSYDQVKAYILNGSRQSPLNHPTIICEVANAGTDPLKFPNNEFGMGAVDALIAVTAAQNGGSCV